MRAAQRLAIQGDHLSSRQHVDRLDPLQRAALKLGRIQRRKHPPKGVVRRDHMRQRQKLLQPFLLGLPKRFDLHPAFRAADDGADGNGMKSGQ